LQRQFAAVFRYGAIKDDSHYGVRRLIAVCFRLSYVADDLRISWEQDLAVSQEVHCGSSFKLVIDLGFFRIDRFG